MDDPSDRAAIAEMYARYAFALSTQNWSELDRFVLADASYDATAYGAPSVMPWSEFRSWAAEALSAVQGFHTVTGVLVDDLSDFGAKATACFVAALSADAGDGTRIEISEGGWFFDDLVRTTEGWRVQARVEKLGFMRTSGAP